MAKLTVDEYCAPPPALAATVYDSNFELGYQQYNGLGAASDERSRSPRGPAGQGAHAAV